MTRADGDGAPPADPFADRLLDERELAPTWLAQFERWLGESRQAGICEPEAMVLATADGSARPSARTVLLKACDERGFQFFTNLGSRKARELAQNPRAALVFPWHAIHRQVTVTGAVLAVDDARSDDYFQSRAYGSQIGAYASRQSSVIDSRATLEAARAEAELRFPRERAVPRPPWWGGFLLAPDTVEFWQGRRDRLHDRLRYTRSDHDRWLLDRLAP